MPIPSPTAQESDDAYIGRCMSALAEEFPDQKQRAAVCYGKLRDKGKSSGGMRESVQLLETVALGRPQKTDDGVLYGVKILGFESKNGRSYTPGALQKAAPLYEGQRVNVNHPAAKDAGKGREFEARIGEIRNVRFVPESGLYGDFHYLKTHPMAPRVQEAAERMPTAMGFSHNAEGRGSKRNGRDVIESIERVLSVDLVGDPATTVGLFESEQFETEVEPGLRAAVLQIIHEATFNPPAEEPMSTAAQTQPVENIPAAAETKPTAKPAAKPVTEQQEAKPVAEATAVPATTFALAELNEAVGFFNGKGVSVEASLLEACLALPRERRQAFVESLEKVAKPATAKAPPAPIFARSQEQSGQPLQEHRGKTTIDHTNVLEVRSMLRGLVH
jgi:hypothetical protein